MLLFRRILFQVNKVLFKVCGIHIRFYPTKPKLGIWAYALACYFLSTFANLFSKFSTTIAEFTTFEQTLCLLNLTIVITLLPLVFILSNTFKYVALSYEPKHSNLLKKMHKRLLGEKLGKIEENLLLLDSTVFAGRKLLKINITRHRLRTFFPDYPAIIKVKLKDNLGIKLKLENTYTKSNLDWRSTMFSKSSKLPNSLNAKTITQIVDSHNDIFSLGFGYSWNTDFVTPASAEFRGIVELYHLVMYQLLFIFFFLIVAAFLALQSYLDKTEAFERLMKPKKIFDINALVISQKKYDALFSRTRVIVATPFEKFQVFTRWVASAKYFAASSGSIFWVYFSALEFIWTLVPCAILLFISLPSFTLALALDEAHKPASWIKVVGNQWFWIYEYSTFNENISIFSNIVQGSDLNDQALRLLEPDSSITIPLNKFTRFLVTSSDVIHSWAVPAMGIKIDACPGRINAVSILPTRAGIYYGQCSEICGINHAFMPICVEVVA